MKNRCNATLMSLVGVGVTLCTVACWIGWTTDVWTPKSFYTSAHPTNHVMPASSVSRVTAAHPESNVTAAPSASGVTSSHSSMSASQKKQPWKAEGGRDKESGSFVSFPEQSPFLYSYSAFWDDRGSPMDEPVIRILTIAEQVSLAEHAQLQCLVSCVNVTEFAVANVTLVSFEDVRRYRVYGKEYVRFVAICPLTLCSLGETRVSIGPPSSLTPESSFVLVEIPRKPEKPMELGLCTSLSYWHIDPTRAVEWLEMQRILGVGGVVIYNDSLDAAVSEVFRHYDQTDFVELRQCHLLFDPSSWTDISIRSALTTTDCLYRYMYTFRNIMVIDTDEVIYPGKHRDLPALMDKLRNETSHNTMNWIFPNANFLFDEELNPNIDFTKPKQLTFLRHRQHLPITPPHPKSIINPMICVVVFNHLCRISKSMNNTVKKYHVLASDGYVRHYRNTLCDKTKKTISCRDQYPIADSVRDDSILRYEDSLVAAVLPKLKSLGLFQGN